jgi:cytochrome P450
LPNLSEVDVGAAMMHTTLHIISRAMFSANSDEIVDVVEQGVGRYQTTVRPSLLDLLAFPAWFTKLFSSRRGTAAVFNEFDKAVDQLINSRGRQPNGQPKDLLARLVAARDADTGGGMTAKEVRDEVVTIFMAGHETTAQALTWTWYLLSLHPSAEAKLHEELTTALNGRTPQYEDIANLRYTRTFNGRCWVRAVLGRDLLLALADCNESLRLRPENADTLDSRALVELKLGQLDRAREDYDAALKIYPRLADSLYGRGDVAGARVDLAAAKTLDPGITDDDRVPQGDGVEAFQCCSH